MSDDVDVPASDRLIDYTARHGLALTKLGEFLRKLRCSIRLAIGYRWPQATPMARPQARICFVAVS